MVAGDAHRAHDPPYEVNYGEVVRPAYERVERAERIRDALAAAGHPLIEPVGHGMAPVLAVRAGPGRVPGGGVAGLEAAGPGPDPRTPSPSAGWAGAAAATGRGRQRQQFYFDTATPLVEAASRPRWPPPTPP